MKKTALFALLVLALSACSATITTPVGCLDLTLTPEQQLSTAFKPCPEPVTPTTGK